MRFEFTVEIEIDLKKMADAVRTFIKETGYDSKSRNWDSALYEFVQSSLDIKGDESFEFREQIDSIVNSLKNIGEIQEQP